MTPLSVVSGFAGLRRLLATGLIAAGLAACAADPASPVAAAVPATNPPAPKPVCSAPPPVQDIWKLEPMLTEKGLITAEMSREQKEAAIRDYIRRKNETFLKDCHKTK